MFLIILLLRKLYNIFFFNITRIDNITGSL